MTMLTAPRSVPVVSRFPLLLSLGATILFSYLMALTAFGLPATPYIVVALFIGSVFGPVVAYVLAHLLWTEIFRSGTQTGPGRAYAVACTCVVPATVALLLCWKFMHLPQVQQAALVHFVPLLPILLAAVCIICFLLCLVEALKSICHG